MNETTEKVVEHLNIAWQEVESGIIAAYDDGYTGLVWQLKQIQMQLENLESTILEKEYDND